MSRILVINSYSGRQKFLSELLDDAGSIFTFSLWSNPDCWLFNFFKERTWLQTPLDLPTDFKKYRSQRFLFWLLAWLKLLHAKFFKKIKKVILINWPEKIIFSAPAAQLGLEVIWLEYPDQDSHWPEWLFLAYRRQARRARLVSFTGQTKQVLKKMGVPENRIVSLPPGVRAIDYHYQKNIFDDLAKHNHAKFEHYFTIGAMVDLSQSHQVETLLEAVKICLTLEPRLQLVLVAVGGERKLMAWLIDKLGLHDNVWLVGEQTELKKWLVGFDCLVIVSSVATLDDFIYTLAAMVNGLPVLAPESQGLQDIIIDEQTGILTDMSNEDWLSRKIISLMQSPERRRELGLAGQERALRDFDYAPSAAVFKQLLN